MATRYDVSKVPLQGGYVAKQCPVRAQNDAVVPGVPIEPDPFQQRLFDQGNAFEADVVTDLLAGQAATVVVEGGGDAAEAATLAAMRDCSPLILNGRLTDPDGRRVGKPDVLVFAPGGGYRAVDVKWHMALDVAKASGKSVSAMVSPLITVGYEHAVEDPAFSARKHQGDLFQLAHYQRMLEAIGMAPPSGRLAGIIGTERQVVWQDLDVPMWRTPSLSETTKLRTTMERYDFEFHFRLDIIAIAQQHQADPSVELLVVPVRCGECPSCPWNDYCRPILETPPGDVSLLPRIGWVQWKAHRDRGVTNRAELAALDVRTAHLIAAKIDVETLMASVAGRDPLTSVLELNDIWPKNKQLEQLHSSGIETVADVLSLDVATARYSDTGMGSLVEQIDMARASIGLAPVYKKRGVDNIVVPRADVEVDIDMENIEDGVYLWGNLVTDRANEVETPKYVPFVTWEPMTTEVEAENSLAFWRWLMDLRSATHANGLTFAAYCYNAPAENTYLRRLGLSAELEEEIEAFIASDEWVDILRVFDSQLITGGSSGLKVTAPLAGFSWPVDDPGGGESMVMHDVAVAGATESERGAARTWLLSYNEADVSATLALREWMTRESATIPAIADFVPATRGHS
jgi:predicted RecB family nuclease